MPAGPHLPQPSPVDALRRLISLRWLSIVAMGGVLLCVPWLLDIRLPGESLLPVLAALLVANGLSMLRLRHLAEIHAAELFGQLCIELAAWSAFLYFTGGATNPLISLLLPLVAIGAATLGAPYAWALAGLAVAAYSVLWDFNALNYRDQIDPKRFDVVIPSDGSVIAGYTTIINKWAKNPNAAKLAREYILSDAGQINLARGYARPIRSNVTLPDDVKAKLLPAEQYANAKPVQDHAAWEQSSKALPRQWQETVMINMQ